MSTYARKLKGKIVITATLRVLTGLHIGASNEFSSIGAVDSVVVRDPLTRRPIIPGSSMKGKLRSLLARSHDGGPYYKFQDEPVELKRLFGGEEGGKNNEQKRLIPSRLQFFDIFMKKESAEQIEKMETDLYLTEIKFENTIDRITGQANPRQLERVPAGAEFDFCLVYNVEEPEEVEADFRLLAKGLKLLQMDYLGKGGTRGNGRVAFGGFQLRSVGIEEGPEAAEKEAKLRKLEGLLEETGKYALLHV